MVRTRATLRISGLVLTNALVCPGVILTCGQGMFVRGLVVVCPVLGVGLVRSVFSYLFVLFVVPLFVCLVRNVARQYSVQCDYWQN